MIGRNDKFRRYASLISKEQKKLIGTVDKAIVAKEDREFYPVLRKAAESNQRLKELLAEFDKDMKEISRYSIEFFDNNNVITGGNLAMELEKFVSIMERRILREEMFLFAEFGKLNQ